MTYWSETPHWRLASSKSSTFNRIWCHLHPLSTTVSTPSFIKGPHLITLSWVESDDKFHHHIFCEHLQVQLLHLNVRMSSSVWSLPQSNHIVCHRLYDHYHKVTTSSGWNVISTGFLFLSLVYVFLSQGAPWVDGLYTYRIFTSVYFCMCLHMYMYCHVCMYMYLFLRVSVLNVCV